MVRMGTTNGCARTDGDRGRRRLVRWVAAAAVGLAVVAASTYTVVKANGSSAASSPAGATGREAAVVASAPSHTDPSTCAPTRPAPVGTSHRILESNGLAREYVLDVPSGYDGTRPAPLL